MPWCGTFGTIGGWWWVFPLLFMVGMAVFALVCMRGLGCMGWRTGRRTDDVAALHREIQELKDDVRKLRSAT
jgi:hypothetical protein